jgi:hypothetical protein
MHSLTGFVLLFVAYSLALAAITLLVVGTVWTARRLHEKTQ